MNKIYIQKKYSRVQLPFIGEFFTHITAIFLYGPKALSFMKVILDGSYYLLSFSPKLIIFYQQMCIFYLTASFFFFDMKLPGIVSRLRKCLWFVVGLGSVLQMSWVLKLQAN